MAENRYSLILNTFALALMFLIQQDTFALALMFLIQQEN